jgi:hypothetical protein
MSGLCLLTMLLAGTELTCPNNVVTGQYLEDPVEPRVRLSLRVVERIRQFRTRGGAGVEDRVRRV